MGTMNNVEKKVAAIVMRKAAKSYGEIGKKLDIPKSTLSYWLKNIPLTREQRSHFYTERIKNLAEGPRGSRARRQAEVDAILKKARLEVSSILGDEAYKFLGAGLYWAEGNKQGMLAITNSDPALIYFMVHWFERTFGVNRKTFKAKLNIYSQQNDADLKLFWSDVCGIPLHRFGKSYIKPTSKGVKKNNLYYGTIQINIPKSSDMRWRVFGWIDGALSNQSKEISKHLKHWGRLQLVERPVNLR